MLERDLSVLQHIVSYCKEIENDINRFGDDLSVFQNDSSYQRSCCMSILQIGELAGKLSEQAKNAELSIPWQTIKAMRNVFAHNYSSLDTDKTWETIKLDIPVLLVRCESLIDKQKQLTKIPDTMEEWQAEIARVKAENANKAKLNENTPSEARTASGGSPHHER